jgi:glycosyltransferase involved in cell wall biosynthesis
VNKARTSVVHLVGQLDIGGMEKLLVEFARHADRDRFTLHFISLGPRGPLADDLEECGWPVTALGQPPGLDLGLVWRLTRLFRELRARVVHTHNTRPLLYGGPAARLTRGCRVIHTRHGQRFQARGRQTVAFRLATRLAHRVVCVSEDSLGLSLAEGVSRARLRTIHNGIDVRRFQAAGPNPDGPAVMVSRLSPEKDVETLLAAAALVARIRPSFRLEIAGDGACLPGLRQSCRELGLEAHVLFLGPVRDVAGLLARASLFVLPSLTEGISLTILEAMSTALPVVATRVGGNPEVVLEGTTGLLVPPHTPDALAGAMLQLLDDPAQGRRLGLAGRDRVERCFDIRQTVSAYEDLYTSVISQQPEGSGTLTDN